MSNELSIIPLFERESRLDSLAGGEIKDRCNPSTEQIGSARNFDFGPAASAGYN